MSISALSSSLVTDLSQQHRQNPFEQIQQDFSQLASALQSGNLTDAQSAYSSIQQLLSANQNSSGTNNSASGSNAVQSDFAALGTALQSGDLTQAQSAFAQLQTALQPPSQSGANGSGAAAEVQDQYVSSTSQTLTPEQQVEQNYSQLASALQSGNLTSAQSAFSALDEALQTQTSSSSSATSPLSSTAASSIVNDFNAVGSALSSGSLTQAQSAFTQLQSALETPQTLSPAQQVQQDYGQLASALQSGNLTDAQSAFTALEQALQAQTGTSASPNTSSTSSSDPIANDLSALGQALSSGNLTQAQSTFAQLQSDIQSAQQSTASQAKTLTQALGESAKGHHHHHHHGGGSSSSNSSSTSSTSTTSSSTSSSSVSVYG